MQTNTQTMYNAARGLRPEAKPMMLQMSGPFLKAASKVNLVKLIALIKRIFLRLGFDGYRCERKSDGFRIRICGTNLNTGRYCDNRSIGIGRMDIVDDFVAGIEDRGGYYALSISMANETPVEAA